MSNTEMNTNNNTTNNNNNNNNEQKETTNSTTTAPLEIRFLIENASVGGLIGKGGANVQRVRDESGASVSILKSDGRQYHERILIMRGSVEQMARAVAMLCDLLVEAQKEREKREFEEQSQDNTNNASSNNTSDQVTLRLLVHKSAVGAVIGRAGAVIKETQTETNARVQVSNEALPGSTEKTITISGVPSAVYNAFSRVAQQLQDNPLKSNIRNIPYTPGHHNTRHAPHSQFIPYPNPIAAGVGPTSTQKIAIPTVCAGCIIGKGGSVIRDLRAQSGTNISISVPDPLSPSERVVTLTGSPDGIHTAVYLIRQLVEQYQPAANQREQR